MNAFQILGVIKDPQNVENGGQHSKLCVLDHIFFSKERDRESFMACQEETCGMHKGFIARQREVYDTLERL